MPFVIKTNQMHYKDPDGNYVTGTAVADKTTAEQVAAIVAASTAEQQKVAQKGIETRATIPDDYTALSDRVEEIGYTDEHYSGIIPLKWEQGNINSSGQNTSANMAKYLRTDFAEVVPGETIKVNKSSELASSIMYYYDADKALISRRSLAYSTHMLPDNCAYIRVTASYGGSAGEDITPPCNWVVVYREQDNVLHDKLNRKMERAWETISQTDIWRGTGDESGNVTKDSATNVTIRNLSVEGDSAYLAVNNMRNYARFPYSIVKMNLGAEQPYIDKAAPIPADVSEIDSSIGAVYTCVHRNHVFVAYRFGQGVPSDWTANNGALAVFDKNTLEHKLTITSTGKVSSVSAYGDYIITGNQRGGWALYFIKQNFSSEIELVKLYEEQILSVDIGGEWQGGEIFVHNNTLYVAFANYTRGVKIYKITTNNTASGTSVETVVEYSYPGNTHCFDVTVDSPYVYATIAPIPGNATKPENPEDDTRLMGIVVLNIDNDTLNGEPQTVLIPAEYRGDYRDTPSADSMPNIIKRRGNDLYINNYTSVAKFHIDENHIPEFVGIVGEDKLGINGFDVPNTNNLTIAGTRFNFYSKFADGTSREYGNARIDIWRDTL